MTVTTTRRTAKADKPIRVVEEGISHGLPFVIQRDPNSDDYPMIVDGTLIGFASGVIPARLTISIHCEEVTRHTRATTADMAADAADAEEIFNTPTPARCRGYGRACDQPATQFVAITRQLDQAGTRLMPETLAYCDECMAARMRDEADQSAAPTRDDLAAALDAAVTARLPIPRDTPEWDAAQALVERARAALTVWPERAPQSPDDIPADMQLFTCDLCHELKSSPELTPDDGDGITVCLRCADGRCPSCGDPSDGLCGACREAGEQELLDAMRSSCVAARRSPAALGADLEYPTDPPVTLPSECWGYSRTCLSPATRVLVTNTTEAGATIDPVEIAVCDDCATKWAPYVIPAGTCYACGGAHHIQACNDVRAALMAYDKGAGTGGNPVITIAVPSEETIPDYIVRKSAEERARIRAACEAADEAAGDTAARTQMAADDPCAEVRRELEEAIRTLKRRDEMVRTYRAALELAEEYLTTIAHDPDHLVLKRIRAALE